MNDLIVRDYSDLYQKNLLKERLETLIIDLYLFDFEFIVNIYFPNVKTIILQSKCQNLHKFILYNFPKLESIKSNNNAEFISMNRIMMNNPIKEYTMINHQNSYSEIIISNTEELDNMIKLESLSIINYTIFNLSQTLINLRTLDITNNKYIKKLPNSYVNLKSLTIRGCKSIKNIPESYIYLEYLNASNSGLVNIHKNLVSLKHLDCYGSDLTRVELNMNNTLELISLGKTKVKKLNLWNNRTLKYLSIKDSKIYIIIKDNTLPKLEYLNIENNKSFTLTSSPIYTPSLKILFANNSIPHICNVIKLNKNIINTLHIAYSINKNTDLLSYLIGDNIEELSISTNIFFGRKFDSLKSLTITDMHLDRINAPNLKDLYMNRASIKTVKNLEKLEMITALNTYEFPDIKHLKNISYISNCYITTGIKRVIESVDIDYKNKIIILYDECALRYLDIFHVMTNIKGFVNYSNSLHSIPNMFKNIIHLEWFADENSLFNYIHPSFKQLERVYVFGKDHIILSKKMTNLSTLKTDETSIINNPELIQSYIDTINIKKEECSICYEYNHNIVQLDCKHTLCMKCLEQIENLCPFCRREIL